LKSLEETVKEARKFTREELGIDIDKSILTVYDDKEWEKFCDINGFESKSYGLYIPKAYKAYVRETPTAVPDTLHELLGHGLFCEHSTIGKEIVNIERSGGDSKKYFGSSRSEENPFGICDKRIDDYEGFAMWLEEIICDATARKDEWRYKKDRTKPERIALQEHFQFAERNLTRFGLMTQMGFPKKYDDIKILEVLKKFYGDKFSEVSLILTYGSKKPSSDIDVFVVSDRPTAAYYNGWLDIYQINKEEFENSLGMLDISVTDALFTGKTIYGDNSKVGRLKKIICSMNVSEAAIAHNNTMSETQLTKPAKNEREIKMGKNYSKTYELNAKLLSQGIKALTMRNLQNDYGFVKL